MEFCSAVGQSSGSTNWPPGGPEPIPLDPNFSLVSLAPFSGDTTPLEAENNTEIENGWFSRSYAPGVEDTGNFSAGHHVNAHDFLGGAPAFPNSHSPPQFGAGEDFSPRAIWGDANPPFRHEFGDPLDHLSDVIYNDQKFLKLLFLA